VVLTNLQDHECRLQNCSSKSYVADLGVRYMFNNKFGIKADFGYNSFSVTIQKVLIQNTTEQIYKL
jgi:hypothetical protein